jgi:hypothetical protein
MTRKIVDSYATYSPRSTKVGTTWHGGGAFAAAFGSREREVASTERYVALDSPGGRVVPALKA